MTKTKKDAIKIFENRKVRSVWDADAEKKKEGNESVTNCNQLKL